MSEDRQIIKKFKELNTSNFPDFYSYTKPLDMGLWVLWVVKEELQIRKLTAEEIASIIREVKEISIGFKNINNAFSKAGNRIHSFHENGKVFFEIMKPGKDYLISLTKRGLIDVFYFEPGKRYTSKRILLKNIIEVLKGELRIVDAYCGERTLDILNKVGNNVKFLTRLENLREKERKGFLRELEDFKSEHPNIEFRSYPQPHIHDRFILSSEHFVLLGHSIKDLGGKESFAIVLSKSTSKDIFEALVEIFNRRWKKAKPI